jgi:hypothetical protein
MAHLIPWSNELRDYKKLERIDTPSGRHVRTA